MNDNHIEIKERQSGLFFKGITFLILSVFSLFCALLPYIYSEVSENSTAFFVGGGIAFAFFAAMFVFLLVKECKPNNALVLNSRVFVDCKNVGENIEIEWTNIASVKLMGKKDLPFLGITLENSDIVMAHMKKTLSDNMRENIEEGLPHILIAQSEVRYPINELKDLFVKFTREARLLESDAPKKPKVNPFTTEDVLRAFGKLEPDPPSTEPHTPADEPHTEPTQTEIIEQEIEIDLPCYEKNEADTKDANAAEDPEQQPQVSQNASDTYTADSVESFYSLLRTKAEADKNVKSANEDTEEDFDDNRNDIPAVHPQEPCSEAIPKEEEEEKEAPISGKENDISAPENNKNADKFDNEISELLSKARSSKISEIEKILSEKDIPYSTLRSDSIAEALLCDNSAGAESKNHSEAKCADAPTLTDTQKSDNMSDTKEFFPDMLQINK